MSPRFNLFIRWFANRFFRNFNLAPESIDRIRELESRGSVLYVMRYSSRLDYFLFNTIFQRAGLRLSSFANGLRFYYYRPLLDALRIAIFRPRGRPREVQRSEDQEHVRELALSGQSFFLFLRTARLRSWIRGRSRWPRRDELDLLEEVVSAVWEVDRPIYLVPLAVFWRKGPRSENRFLNLSYGALTRPSDLAKVTSFLATYRSLSVKSGDPIDLRAFITEHRAEGKGLVARKVRRSILSYLYREEKVVAGPTLRAPHRVMESVLSEARVVAAIEERARNRRRSPERERAEAEKIFREIAANQNSTVLAALSFAITQIVKRMFAAIVVDGLDKVAEYAKRHPVVLVPSHRSYFDFLLLSWLFYGNFLVPPHVLARENMGFGPFGFLFRRVGAFFMRRSPDDPLYKEVFRAYVGYLVREGFTQEFFIEGGRSRTGKTQAPRLGMLAWDVQAFLDCARRDLFFVPVSITYERLVEESSMVGELKGGARVKESTWGLVRARKLLRRGFGSVHLRFGDPISLAEAMGDRRERFARAESDEAIGERRRFIEDLGHHIVERINAGAVANSTSVAASVLLGSRHRGLLREEFVNRMQQVVDLLGMQDVRLTAALVADEGEFRESITFMVRSDLIRISANPCGEILYFDESRRPALDLYRNSIAQFLATPSVLAQRLLAGASRKELVEDLAAWQDLFYQEFFTPRGEDLRSRCDAFLEHFERSGWIEGDDQSVRATEFGRPFLQFLAEQTRGLIEAYHAACTVVLEEDLEVDRAEFHGRAAAQFEHAHLLGEAERSEAANEITFSNALDLLVRRGILEARSVPAKPGRALKREGRDRVVYARGERADALGELRERLAAALSSR
ncbi:MAG: 1-acyl-sn-glycerol-3-phosphate acyltransferase [Myxococcota bacterium]